MSNEPDFIEFSNEILGMMREGFDLDVLEVKQLAIKNGLLKHEEMKKPCSETCECEGNGAIFPTKCLIKTYSVFENSIGII